MKTFRIWVYAFLEYNNKIIVVKKKRWPFSGLYDLPWWKIEHGEWNIEALQREIKEEVWLKKDDIEINKILWVYEDFSKHIWEWEEKDEHIIAIVYKVVVLRQDFNTSFIEKWWDSAWFEFIDIYDNSFPKTNILKKVIEQYILNI